MFYYKHACVLQTWILRFETAGYAVCVKLQIYGCNDFFRNYLFDACMNYIWTIFVASHRVSQSCGTTRISSASSSDGAKPRYLVNGRRRRPCRVVLRSFVRCYRISCICWYMRVMLRLHRIICAHGGVCRGLFIQISGLKGWCCYHFLNSWSIAHRFFKTSAKWTKCVRNRGIGSLRNQQNASWSWMLKSCMYIAEV